MSHNEWLRREIGAWRDEGIVEVTMIAETLMMATTVWYVPGWMRLEAVRERGNW